MTKRFSTVIALKWNALLETACIASHYTDSAKITIMVILTDAFRG
ncbi:MAG TPA: hypothetical protein VFI73_08780 [Candidatus Nitrosopolaris sp.]|nr:hypothetical protein [Candidatus Nitrosopolaris sp.]